MKLILARHGNNFAPSDKVVWVGAREDLPLVESGIAQAVALGAALKRAGFAPKAVLCSPLQRTQVYAQTALTELGSSVAPQVKSELNEIDYGSWGGLSTEEIIAANPGADAAMDAWEKQSVWPAISPWQPGAEALSKNAKVVADRLSAEGKDAMVVSSNGILRYFLKLVPGEWDRRVAAQDFKMKTGRCGLMEFANGEWTVLGWNLKPEDLANLLK